MSAILALDSSTAVGSVALGAGDELLAETLLQVRAGASARLMPAVDQALRMAGVERPDLSAVVVAAGPGSFTGLRIGAATAKGVAHALRLPMYAYSTLLMSAAAAWASDRPVCALLDARRRDVFAACYRFHPALEVIVPPSAISVDEVIGRFEHDEVPVFTGSGSLLHADELRQRLRARVLPPELAPPRASSLLWLQRTMPDAGRIDDWADWEPEYLRASGAERIAAERAAGRAGGAGRAVG